MYGLGNSKDSLATRKSKWERDLTDKAATYSSPAIIIPPVKKNNNQELHNLEQEKLSNKVMQLEANIIELSAKVTSLEKTIREINKKLSISGDSLKYSRYSPHVNNKDYCTFNNFCELSGTKFSLLVEILTFSRDITIYPFADDRSLPKFINQKISMVIDDTSVIPCWLKRNENNLYIIEVHDLFDNEHWKSYDIDFPIVLKCDMHLQI